ncbi:MAG: hypothetical protein RBT05_06520 [Bacteroidales bacterium]|nr:hypothetical protein [Bacteroidales bacterium]
MIINIVQQLIMQERKKSLSKSNSVFETEERKIVYYGDKDENNYPSWDDFNYIAEDINLNVEK